MQKSRLKSIKLIRTYFIVITIVLLAFACTPKHLKCLDNSIPNFCISFNRIEEYKLLPTKASYTVTSQTQTIEKNIDVKSHEKWRCSPISKNNGKIRCCSFEVEKDGFYQIKISWKNHTSLHETHIHPDEFGCHIETAYLNEDFTPKN